MPRFQELDYDVLHHIVMELVSAESSGTQWLKSLSLTCRCVRESCMPVLFQRCYGRTFSRAEVPPEAIRPYVRHITFVGSFANHADLYACGYLLLRRFNPDQPRPGDMTAGAKRSDVRPFGAELAYFPATRSVGFYSCGGVPWHALQLCFENPRIDSVTIVNSPWTCVFPPPTSAHLPADCRVVNFLYKVSQWRGVEAQIFGHDIQAAYELESTYLRKVVPGIADRVERLYLPIETAPFDLMATMNWPRLRSLSLASTQLQPSLYDLLPDVLIHMPQLHTLSVMVSPPNGLPMVQLVKDASKAEWCRNLRSLTVAYPNPADAIFPALSDKLTHLSLRDTPRYYLYDRYAQFFRHTKAPLLTSSASLDILRNTTLAQVSTLEVVYMADDAEDELLRHIVSACPLLQDIELHRYRESEYQDIPYMHIAYLLQPAEHIRAVHLNLDFEDIRYSDWDDPMVQAGCLDAIRRRAHEVLPAFDGCRCFEFVAFLVDTDNEGKWLRFRPAWHDYVRFPDWGACTLDAESPPLPEP